MREPEQKVGSGRRSEKGWMQHSSQTLVLALGKKRAKLRILAAVEERSPG